MNFYTILTEKQEKKGKIYKYTNIFIIYKMGWLSRNNKEVKENGVALVMRSNPKAFSFSDEKTNEDTEKTFKIYKNAYEKVPLITAIIDITADQTVQDFYFDGTNKTELEEWSDQVNFPLILHRIVKMMLLYGNAYVEVIKGTDDAEDELKVINSIHMMPYRNTTGDVIGYSQIIEGSKEVLWGTTGDKEEDRKFKKRISNFDNILHFKHNILGNEKLGRSIVAPLIPALEIKLDMEQNLRKVLFKYIAPLIWAKVGNDSFPASSSAVSDVSTTLRDLQAESEVTTTHLVELSVLDFNSKGMDIQTPINHIESQIITGGGVPPVLLGRLNGDDKAADAQLRSWGRRIKSIQREVKYLVEDEIIVKQLGFAPENKFIWVQSEEREWQVFTDILRGLVTDGILTPQKANDLLPPRFQEELPEMIAPERGSQMKNNKITDNPNNPQKTTKNPRSMGARIHKPDREPADE